MRISIDDKEVFWFKEWREEVDPLVGYSSEITEIKFLSNDGILILTGEFKCYLHPKSKANKAFRDYLEENDNKVVDVMVIEVVKKYPFWEIASRDDKKIELHNHDEREVQVLPVSPNSRGRKTIAKP